jgi:hypothetical protein
MQTKNYSLPSIYFLFHVCKIRLPAAMQRYKGNMRPSDHIFLITGLARTHARACVCTHTRTYIYIYYNHYKRFNSLLDVKIIHLVDSTDLFKISNLV